MPYPKTIAQAEADERSRQERHLEAEAWRLRKNQRGPARKLNLYRVRRAEINASRLGFSEKFSHPRRLRANGPLQP